LLIIAVGAGWRWCAVVFCVLLLAAGGLAGLRPVAATATATQELKARVTLVWSAGLAHGTRNGTDM
jgi:hypothetical protein